MPLLYAALSYIARLPRLPIRGLINSLQRLCRSFVIPSTCSYLAAILPHVLSRRANVNPGPFWMRGLLGYVVHGIACSYMVTFIVIHCFPYSLPASAVSMNYACLITGGLTIFVAAWWFWVGKRG